MINIASLLRFTVVSALLSVTTVHAAIMKTLDEPDTTIASNTVIDIVEHDGGIWMATGQGLNFSLDTGRTWLLYNSANGLLRDDISALLSFRGRLWVAGAYSQVVGGSPISYSDTIQYTDDGGQTFETINLNKAGAIVPYAVGGQRTVYDIAGGTTQDTIDWVFFGAFAGAFVGSRDGGETWRRLYPSRADSINFIAANTSNVVPRPEIPLNMRVFSCVADTTHSDSMFAWVGTAAGALQYVYAPRENKPSSHYVSDIVFCSDCLPGDTTVVFIGGDNGVTRASTSGQIYHSAFVEDGLPGAFVNVLYPFGGRLFAGTWESRTGNAAGLAVSDDAGETFTEIDEFIPFTAIDERIHDMVAMNGRLYVAAETAGLWVSDDTGDTWSVILVDSLNPGVANRRNVVWGLDALADTLRVGTDSGLVTLHMDPTGTFEAAESRFDVFPETPATSGTRVIDVFSQVFLDTLGNFDSLAVWTIDRPVSGGGAPSVHRGTEDTLIDFPDPGDTTIFWNYVPYQQNAVTNDLEFFGDTVFAAGNSGLRWSDDGGNPLVPYQDHVRDSVTADVFTNSRITVMTGLGDTVFVGSDSGFAITHAFSETFGSEEHYRIFRTNKDTLSADFVVTHDYLGSLGEITSSFIPAMGLQYLDTEPFARVWLSCHPLGGDPGLTVGRYEIVDTASGRRGMVWEHVLDSVFSWNFGFNGDTVFAPSDAGLLVAYDDDFSTWDTLPLADAEGNVLVGAGVSVYAAEVIGAYLWVGTDEATVRLRLDNLIADTSYFYVDFDSPSDEVYAYPVPIRMSGDGAVDFHLAVESTARVTIEIYDAAMNLVSRVMDGEELAAGIYHGHQTGLPTWDGRNGRGDQVAVGVYYFKVEYSTGEVRWGKLAVIP